MKTEFLNVGGLEFKVLKKKKIITDNVESYLVYTERGTYKVSGKEVDRLKFYGKSDNSDAYCGTIKKAAEEKKEEADRKIA